jgi:amino acid adenylation domain-containing protein
MDPAYLVETIRRNKITMVDFVPPMLQAFLEHADAAECSSLVHVICGGEAISAKLARWCRERLPHTSLHNSYGPTETTVDAAEWTCPAEISGASVPIGRPIANTRIYILDAHGEPAPVGVAGELYIGGASVARGYLNRPELTAERFLKDPFISESAARMYKTGDLGRWLADGNIEFLGRNDSQVKIRGFRIELGEIEARLAEHPAIREAVVLAREDQPGETRLAAYYVPVTEDEDELGVDALREHLSKALPEYMVPAAYMRLEALPLTPNGKLDRKALPAPDDDAYSVRGYEEPQGEIETLLARIWVEVLKLDRVGRHDNFFHLGGHSLLAVTLIERMRRSGVQADVRTLFATPTLAELAAAVAGTEPQVQIPPNMIPAGCTVVMPEMLPLVALSAEQIDRIVSQVPGGAGNVQDIYPLAPLQEGILFHHLMAQQGDPYLLSSLVGFDNRERLDVFLKAMQAVVDRHDILRTAIFWEGLPEPVQVVLRKAILSIEEVLLDADAADAAEQLYAQFDPRRSRIDLHQAPLLRVFTAYDSRHNRWLLLTLQHHLAGDHTAADVLQEEIQAHLLGRQEQLPAPLPFRNFVAQARLGISREEHEAFFRKMLGDVDEPTAPFGLLEVRGDGTGIAEAPMEVDASLSSRMREHARRLGVSVASLCHLAWALVLARITGREDVVFGTMLFGRMQSGEGADRVMGLFINLLPLRIQIGGQTALDSVRRTQILLAELLRHEHASLALAQRCSAVQAPAPLFSAPLNYRHVAGAVFPPFEEAQQALQGIEWIRSEERTNYPFGISVDDLGDGFRLVAQVDVSIDPTRVCAFMHTALASLITALDQAPERPLRSLDVLPAEERQQVLYGWNNTATEYPSDRCLHQLFEEQVERAPEGTALVFEDRELSYEELNRQSNRLAHHLRELGIQPDDRVAICVERGFDMIVSLLAVLKAGGAYVPLDPAYPAERLRFMLDDSGPVALLTQTDLRHLLPQSFSFPILLLGHESPAWNGHSDTNPDPAGVALTPNHLAYVIYTSGSTGTPKGVMVQHRGLVNLVLAQIRAFALDGASRVLQFASFSFDACASEIFTSICQGASLHLVAQEDVLSDPTSLFAQTGKEITHATLTPAVLATFPKDSELGGLSTLVVAGDVLPDSLAERWKPGRRLINAYGPTEATVCATLHICDGRESRTVPIGRPIANMRIYILNGRREPVPVGVVGELYIGGAGVARGYLNQPELTAERFLTDPFISEPGARMYKTGDLGRWLPDGNIEFLGRNDFQVKLRGFRIELGEIEARLAEHPGIRAAVVLAREDQPGDKRLVAYYVPVAADQDELSVDALRAHLSQALPEYMVPAAYVRLEALPLTPTGKLDRNALQAPEADHHSLHGYEEPRGETEILLARIWIELLAVDRVGRHDNFFDLGGHSLLAIQLISRIQQALDLEMEISDIFAHPSLEELADSIVTRQLARFESEELASALRLMQSS